MRIELVVTEDNGRLHSHDFGNWNDLATYIEDFTTEDIPISVVSENDEILDSKLEEMQEVLTPVKNNNIIETVKSWLK